MERKEISLKISVDIMEDYVSITVLKKKKQTKLDAFLTSAAAS